MDFVRRREKVAHFLLIYRLVSFLSFLLVSPSIHHHFPLRPSLSFSFLYTSFILPFLFFHDVPSLHPNTKFPSIFCRSDNAKKVVHLAKHPRESERFSLTKSVAFYLDEVVKNCQVSLVIFLLDFLHCIKQNERQFITLCSLVTCVPWLHCSKRVTTRLHGSPLQSPASRELCMSTWSS